MGRHEDGDHEVVVAGLHNAVVLARRAEHRPAGVQLPGLVAHGEGAAALKDAVDLVVLVVAVQGLLLARLEAVDVARTGTAQGVVAGLGILHQPIGPALRQENGAHERMHRTLKAATCGPPAANPAAQQGVFYRFRRLHNEERPRPSERRIGSRYCGSPRAYPEPLPPIRLRHKLIFLAQGLGLTSTLASR